MLKIVASELFTSTTSRKLLSEQKKKKKKKKNSNKMQSIIALLFVTDFSGGSRISPRWGRQLSGGRQTYDFANFPPKLHGIERIWTPVGGGGEGG